MKVNRRLCSYLKNGEVGFSLIEVVISLAIIATVGISMIGMIPTGFENVRKAGELSVVSRIIQIITSDANSSDWEEYRRRFTGSNGVVQFFDDQGSSIEESGGFSHIYTALIEISGSSPGGSSVMLPGDELTRIDRSDDLRKLVVKITSIPGEEGIEALRNAGDDSNFLEYFVIVSNFKRDGKNVGK